MEGKIKPYWLLSALILFLFPLLLSPLILSAQDIIQVKGSDTEVNLVQKLAEVYLEQRPDVLIAVTGGGSGTGIAALINGKADLVNSSRAMKDEEIQAAKARGIRPTAVIFALDGLSIIVHPKNPVNSMTLAQLGQIYRGEIKNWAGPGGSHMAISLYGRQPNSGTYVYFRDVVLKGDYSAAMKEMNGNAQIVEAVRRDQGSIGYVGIGYAVQGGKVIGGIKVLKLARENTAPALNPVDPKNIATGQYPLLRPLYQYTNGFPKGNILNLIRFELSPEGQKLVQEMGFYPVSLDYQKANKAAGF